MKLGEFRIPKNPNKAVIYILLVLVTLEEFAISSLHVPSVIRYIIDFLLLGSFICCLPAIQSVLRRTGLSGTGMLMILFTVSVIVGLLWNGGSPMLIAWATRNTYRFFAFFLICLCTLEKFDILTIFDWLSSLQWLNLILCLIQFLVLGLHQDNIGGIFGTNVGCNMYMNIYLLILVTYATCRYMNKTCTVSHFLKTLIISMVIAGISELKFFYLEILFIAGMTALLFRPSKKTLFLVIGVAAALVAGLLILKQFFPKHYDILMDLFNIIDYGNNMHGGYRLSRFQSFSAIDRVFFKGDPVLNLFGLGFGNCEYSNFSFLTSPFYNKYMNYHYRWFSNQMMLLETGFVGLGLYIAILLSVAWNALRTKSTSIEHDTLRKFVFIFALITVVNLWYNSAVRIEAGYLVYFALSAAAVVEKTDKQEAEKVSQGT